MSSLKYSFSRRATNQANAHGLVSEIWFDSYSIQAFDSEPVCSRFIAKRRLRSKRDIKAVNGLLK